MKRAIASLLLLSALMVFSESYQNPEKPRSEKDSIAVSYFWDRTE